jgi:hypothetical protein
MNISGFFPSALVLAGALSLAVVPVLHPSQGAGPKGTVYQFVVPKQGAMIGDATYYCWIPQGMQTLRAIVVHQHGCTTEGSAPPMVTDVQWLTLAKKWNSAFVAPMLVTGPNGTPDCNNWYDINNGSANCFIEMLDTLARRSGHAEIKTIPWALWGHSGGSIWVTAMTGKYPDRVAVTVAQACATDISNVPAALKVPVLHHNGKLDLCYNDVQFSNGRKKGALWAHAINPNVASTGDGHMVHDMRLLAIPWMDACMSMRLPLVAGDSLLRDMDTTNVWLGDTGSRAIASAATFTGNKLAACWFPNQTLAAKWKEYMATGTLKDSTLPPAPYNLAGTLATPRFTIKWDCDADLEDGIKTFTVYRNNVLYRTLKYTTTSTYSSIPGFQRWNECDQPNPSPAPEMTFTDSAVTTSGTFVYQLCCVNWSDVEGIKSAPITLQGGQVTGVKAQNAAGKGLHNAKSVFRYSGKGWLALDAGIIDIYDINGRLLKSFQLPSAQTVDIAGALGGSVQKVVLVKIRN